MSAPSRIARLHRVRKYERSLAVSRLQEASTAHSDAQLAAEAMRAAREMAENVALAAGTQPQAAQEWLAQRTLVESRLELERIADLQVRRLGRQEALRRVEVRAALVREEQMGTLGERLTERRAASEQKSEQKMLDDLRREGGGGR